MISCQIQRITARFEEMQLNTIKQIKIELKRLRNRQDLHNSNRKLSDRKSKLRALLWKLLRAQPRSTPSTRSGRSARTREESENIGKTKGSGKYT